MDSVIVVFSLLDFLFPRTVGLMWDSKHYPTVIKELLVPHVVLLMTDVSCDVSADTPRVNVLTSCLAPC